MVKAGLVLGLFGGSQKYADSRVSINLFIVTCFIVYFLLLLLLLLFLWFQNNIPIRGDPHILVVGDPGLGKSQVRRDTKFLPFRQI